MHIVFSSLSNFEGKAKTCFYRLPTYRRYAHMNLFRWSCPNLNRNFCSTDLCVLLSIELINQIYATALLIIGVPNGYAVVPRMGPVREGELLTEVIGLFSWDGKGHDKIQLSFLYHGIIFLGIFGTEDLWSVIFLIDVTSYECLEAVLIHFSWRIANNELFKCKIVTKNKIKYIFLNRVHSIEIH